MGSMIDKATGRHLSWTGEVIQDLSRTDQWRGHYWRVTDSWRDPRTGAWQMRWTPQSYLGSTAPIGQPVYRHDGTTWDMRAVPSTVFPWLYAAIALAVAIIVGSIFALWQASIQQGWSGGSDAPVVFVILLFAALGSTWLKWMRNIEPVSGTALTAAVTAASIARAEHLRAEEEARVNAAITEANRRSQAQDAAAFAKWEANGSVGPAPIPSAAPLQYPGPKQWS